MFIDEHVGTWTIGLWASFKFSLGFKLINTGCRIQRGDAGDEIGHKNVKIGLGTDLSKCG